MSRIAPGSTTTAVLVTVGVPSRPRRGPQSFLSFRDSGFIAVFCFVDVR